MNTTRNRTIILVSMIIAILLFSLQVFSQEEGQHNEKTIIEARMSMIEEDLASLSRQNVTSQYVTDKIEEARECLEKNDTKCALVAIGEAERRLELIWSILDEVRVTGELINQLEAEGLNSTRPRTLLEQAMEKIRDEDYESASELLEKAQEAASEEQAIQAIMAAKYRAARDNIIAYVRDHPVRVAIYFLIGVLVVSYGLDSAYRTRLKREIARLEREEKILTELCKKVDHEYFIEKKISNETRKISKQKYLEDLENIRERLPVARRELELGLFGAAREKTRALCSRILGMLGKKEK